MERIFKCRASAGSLINGRVGITDSQKQKIANYIAKDKLTDKQKSELLELQEKEKKKKLPDTCTSYLKKYYANDAEDSFNTKETNKGNVVEIDNIDFGARVLGFGILSKNEVSVENEYFTGTADVVTDEYIIDVKSPYCNRTFHNCINDENEAYKAQLQVYMHLYGRRKAILFYGLLDTPATEWSDAVSYSHIPENERWYAIEYAYDSEFINALIERVIECRTWLAEYDLQLQNKLGKLCKI